MTVAPPDDAIHQGLTPLANDGRSSGAKTEDGPTSESRVVGTVQGETALLLIAHGSRVAEANADLERLAALLRAQGPYRTVECSYLELAQPGIAAGAARCVATGAKRVLLVPYFLSAGVHVKRDLEAARDQLATTHPAVDFRLGDPIGLHPLMAKIVLQRAKEADSANTPE